MSAFDWSPGGCCCREKWWFDNLNYEIPAAQNIGRLQRMSGIAPVGKTVDAISSFSYNNWFVPCSNPNSRLHRGFTADGVTAWAAMETAANTYILNTIDIPTKTLRFADNSINPLFDRIAIRPGASGQFVAQLNTSPLTARVYELDGTFATYNNVRGQSISAPDGERIAQYAKLNWPMCSATDTRQLNLANFRATIAYAKFEVAEVVPGMWNSTGSAITNRSVFKEMIYPPSPQYATQFGQPQWANPGLCEFIGFDHFDGHWAAQIRYDTTAKLNGTPAYNNRVELYIDGLLIQSVENTIRGNGFFGLISDPHVCYPHETLGGGYVAVVFDTTPSAPNPHYEMHVYNGGSLVWATSTTGAGITIYGSTDRWIYFSAGGSVPQISKGEFSVAAGSPGTITPLWMARHDGSQIIPCNSAMTNNFGQFSFQQVIGNQWMQGCFARKSSALPNSAPATYQEMYDMRND